MHLEVTPLFDKGRRLSKDELKHVVPVRGDVTIGAVAVSGAPGGDKDAACANAALTKLADKLK